MSRGGRVRSQHGRRAGPQTGIAAALLAVVAGGQAFAATHSPSTKFGVRGKSAWRSTSSWRDRYQRGGFVRLGQGSRDDGGVVPRRAFLEWAQGIAWSGAQTLATLAAAAVAFYSGAKVAVIGQPQKPPCKGPFGTVGSRVERVAGLRCRFFYPAKPGADGKEAAYLSEGTRTSDAMARLVFFPGFLLEHLGLAGSGCVENALPAAVPENSSGYPVLVYSHGQGGNMDMGTYFLRQIASFGLIVVAVEHQDGSASTGDPENPMPFNPTRGQKGVQYRATEVVRVGEALAAPGSPSAALGGGKLLVGGHSYGGPTAIYAAVMKPELFTGLVLHDPALGSRLPVPTQPVTSVVGDQYAGLGGLVEEVKRVSRAQAGKAWEGAWHYKGISHGNFVDAPLWAPLPIMRLLGLLLIPAAGPEDPAEAHLRLAEAAASFAGVTDAPPRATALPFEAL